MTSVSDVLEVHKQLTELAAGLVASKGHDYSGGGNEDTFANIRLAHHLGLVDTPQSSVLVRMGDKFSRLVSLRNPAHAAQVKDESVKDTVVDLINYAIYYYILYKEGAQKLADIEAFGTHSLDIQIQADTGITGELQS